MDRLQALSEALTQSERRFRTLVSAGGVSFFRMSPDWRLMYEMDSESLPPTAGPLEDWPSRYLLPEDRPAMQRSAEAAIRDRAVLELEHRVRQRDGSIGWVLTRAAPLLDERGEIAEWFGVDRDVTESHRALEQLHESEARHRALFESIDEGVCLLERLPPLPDGRSDYRYIAINPAMRALFGIPDLSGQSVRENFPDEVDAWYDDYDRVLDTGEPMRFERVSEPQGMVLELFVTRIGEAGGHRLLLVMRNITERRQMQERQTFLLRLSDALGPLADPIAIQGEAARLLREHFDVGWCCYAEFDEEERVGVVLKDASRDDLPSLVGRHDLSDQPHYIDYLRSGKLLDVPDFAQSGLFTPEVRAKYTAMGIRSLLGVALVKEGRLRGQLVMCDTVPHPWSPLAAELIGEVAQRTWAAVERARAEESLAAELEWRKLAERRKDEFLAVLGHELRNPLAPISTGLALVERSGRAPEVVDRLLPMLQRQALHLNRLVDDLLDMSRVSRGSIELRPTPLDLNDAVRAALEQVQGVIELRQHRLDLHLCEAPLRVHGDAERLTQVIANLLTNAAKYSAPGGAVCVRSAVEGGQACVRVRDRGYGIPPERLEELFEMFVQVPEHRGMAGGAGGLGIGLALARQLVQMHGGSLTAHSEGLGLGSEFVVRLPLLPLAAPAPQRPASAPGPAPGQRILVVDDNLDAAESLVMLLSMEGHQVDTAHDGPEAVARFDAFKPDLVLMDLGLPGFDGLEAARRIRQHPDGARVPLIAVSGWGQAEDRRRTLEAGIDAHLTKPVDPVKLLALIRETCPASAVAA